MITNIPEELASEKQTRLLTLLLMFSSEDDGGLAELLAKGWSVAELYGALEEASAGWSFRRPQQKGAARIVGRAIGVGWEDYKQQVAQLSVDQELRLEAIGAHVPDEPPDEELAKLSPDALVNLCLHMATIARAFDEDASRSVLEKVGASLQARLGDEEKHLLNTIDSAARLTLFAQLLRLGETDVEDGAMVKLLAAIATDEELDAAMEELPLSERVESGEARKSKEAVTAFTP